MAPGQDPAAFRKHGRRRGDNESGDCGVSGGGSDVGLHQGEGWLATITIERLPATIDKGADRCACAFHHDTHITCSLIFQILRASDIE